jgi:hypothetical protein
MTHKELDRLWFQAMEQSIKDGEGASAAAATVRYHFAALVAAAEREACAKVCESQMPNPVKNWADAQIVNALRDCASTIRARGQQQ